MTETKGDMRYNQQIPSRVWAKILQTNFDKYLKRDRAAFESKLSVEFASCYLTGAAIFIGLTLRWTGLVSQTK